MKRPSWLPRLHRSRSVCPDCGTPAREAYCDVCGYDLVRKTQAGVSRYKPL